MMICCPMTSRIKGYPFEVVVSADQIKVLDWRARQAQFKGKVTDAVLAEVRGKLKVLIEF